MSNENRKSDTRNRFLVFADALIKQLNTAALVVGAVFLIIVVGVGTADVIGTNLLNMPVPSSLEISEMSMVFITVGGFAYAMQRQSHVGVDLFVGRLSGAGRNVVTGITLVISLVVFAFLGWRAGIMAMDSVALNEWSSGLLRFPVYPAKLVLAAGCYLTALECLRQFVRLCLGWSSETTIEPEIEKLA